MRPAKTRISLGIRPVWSESSLSSLGTGATKLPKLSRKWRAFQEPCLTFHHETVRIIYSYKCYKNNFQIHNGTFSFMWHWSTIWMTLKQLKGNSLDYILLIMSDHFDNCCSSGLQLRKVWKFWKTKTSLVIRLCPHEETFGPYTLSAQRRLWSDWADAQADPSLHWVHIRFCWFCCAVAHFLFGWASSLIDSNLPHTQNFLYKPWHNKTNKMSVRPTKI